MNTLYIREALSKIVEVIMKYILFILRNPFDFDGRARRTEYWIFSVFYFIISVTLILISMKYMLFIYKGNFLLQNIFGLIMYFPLLSVSIRRYHDVNKSGWNMFIPIYNLILLLRAGTVGRNDYDVDPRDERYYS